MTEDPPHDPAPRAPRRPLWRTALPLIAALIALVSPAPAQDAEHPLKPPDRSSPRATLQTFLESGDAVGAFVADEYLPAPSRAKYAELMRLFEVPLRCLDLSRVPPASREKAGPQAATALYEVLSRITLPSIDEVPGAPEGEDDLAPKRWVIPNTEIAIERVEAGPQAGQYLFSSDTVARSRDLHARVHDLPYVRAVPYERAHDLRVVWGGWMVPLAFVMSLPEWLRAPVFGQAAWKWVAVAVILALALAALRGAFWLSGLVTKYRPFLRALSGLVVPASLLLLLPLVGYMLLTQVYLIGEVGSAVELIETSLFFIAGAWFAWRAAPVFAEGVIASPRIAPQSVDAHLIRTGARVLGIVAAATLLAVGAGRVGIPVYGIVAGLGVGGLALALAAQPSIENLIGGFSLFADKPVRVGNFGQYGDILGTVESIGIRSTKIRGVDRTITTIPNAALSRMPIKNLDRRDQMLIQNTIGVRYETDAEQLRTLLGALRDLLMEHERIDSESARVRFVGFGSSSLDLEIFAYAITSNWAEFLAIREDVFLRVMETLEACGASIAFPSRTLYLSRDGAPRPDDGREHARRADGRGAKTGAR